MGDIATMKNSPQMNNEFLIGIEVRTSVGTYPFEFRVKGQRSSADIVSEADLGNETAASLAERLDALAAQHRPWWRRLAG